MTVHDVDRGADITWEALHLALSAIRLHVAWHAGAISAETAMEDLDREIVGTITRYARSSRATLLETSGRHRANELGKHAVPRGSVEARRLTCRIYDAIVAKHGRPEHGGPQ